MSKSLHAYATIIAGSATLGAFKGFNAAQGNDISFAVDTAMAALPLGSGLTAAIISTPADRYGPGTTGPMIEFGTHVAGGYIASDLAQGVGMGLGYLAGYLSR